METSTFEDFLKLDIRIGTIVEAETFPTAKRPAFRLWIDFGEEVGTKTSSAQITARYQLSELLGRQVLAVVNLPARKIGPFRSEVLTLGLTDTTGGIVLVRPDDAVPNGSRLH